MPVRTRGEHRAELNQVYGPGDETSMLLSTLKAEYCAEDDLAALKHEKVRLCNLLHERRRKLREAKAKFPRPGDESDQDARQRKILLDRAAGGSSMPWVQVATFERAQAKDDEHCQRFQIRCHPSFAEATDGLDGFDKAWIIAIGSGDMSDSSEIACLPYKSELTLGLVTVVSVSSKGLMEVAGSDGELLVGLKVIDIKPYLSYAEAKST